MESEDLTFASESVAHGAAPAGEPDATSEEQARGKAFYALMRKRRSVQRFSGREVPSQLIEWAVRAAGTAPSAGHRQPWRFVAVDSAAIKEQICQEVYAAAEGSNQVLGSWSEEAPSKADLRLLEEAPWVVICFIQQAGEEGQNREVDLHEAESCGVACGIFITALHRMGLATKPYMVSAVESLSVQLKRPEGERPFMLFPVGFPQEREPATAPARKPLDAIMHWNWPDV